MKNIIRVVAVLVPALPLRAIADPIGYSITITTAYSAGDPFPNRLDTAWVQPTTGYFRVANTGSTTFTGVIGDIAVSPFPQVDDMSFQSLPLMLEPGASVSVAIPYNSANVGGFNGPAYFYRPGIEITLDGVFADGSGSETVSLLVADRDIHSGLPRTDQYGLTSDSFVLQGGDPWGFDTGAAFGTSQAYGVYVFSETVQEPAPALIFVGALTATGLLYHARRRVPCQPASLPLQPRPDSRNGPVSNRSAWTE